MATDIGIVLTGTINPNASFIVHSDVNARRKEYLAALEYYKDFAPVYFLENSTYNVLSDSEFNSIKNVFLRKFPVSEHCSCGKGYQEFETISRWVESEVVLPRRFIKITGRYIVLNFKDIFRECSNPRSDHFIIDQFIQTQKALTSLFCIDTNCYKRNLSDVYLGCNDEAGDWIETVLYSKLLAGKVNSSIFRNEPVFMGIVGSTGIDFRSHYVKHLIKVLLRRINRFFNKKFILFR